MEFAANVSHYNSDEELVGEQSLNFDIIFDIDEEGEDDEQMFETFFSADF